MFLHTYSTVDTINTVFPIAHITNSCIIMNDATLIYLAIILEAEAVLNYLIVDDEPYICEDLAYELERLLPEDSNLLIANSAAEALEIAEKNPIYVAFLDVDMPVMNGLELAKVIEEKNLAQNIVFVTGYPDYSLDAWNTQASGFLVKPVQTQKLETCLKKLRNPFNSDAPAKEQELLNFHCFGIFEVTFQGKPLHFKRRKCKEFLAYLIDRHGARVTTGDLRFIFWDEGEDTEEKAAYIRVLASEIRTVLAAIGQEQIFIHEKNNYGLDITKVKCDYYDYLAGDENARRSFRQEYMSQYSWADVTLATLLDAMDA